MGHKRSLIDDGSTRSVDQHRIGLHHFETLRVDEVLRGLVQSAVQAHHLYLSSTYVSDGATGNPPHVADSTHALSINLTTTCLDCLIGCYGYWACHITRDLRRHVVPAQFQKLSDRSTVEFAQGRVSHQKL